MFFCVICLDRSFEVISAFWARKSGGGSRGKLVFEDIGKNIKYYNIKCIQNIKKYCQRKFGSV